MQFDSKQRFLTIAVCLDGEWKETVYRTDDPSWREAFQILKESKNKLKLVYHWTNSNELSHPTNQSSSSSQSYKQLHKPRHQHTPGTLGWTCTQGWNHDLDPFNWTTKQANQCPLHGHRNYKADRSLLNEKYATVLSVPEQLQEIYSKHHEQHRVSLQ